MERFGLATIKITLKKKFNRQYLAYMLTLVSHASYLLILIKLTLNNYLICIISSIKVFARFYWPVSYSTSLILFIRARYSNLILKLIKFTRFLNENVNILRKSGTTDHQDHREHFS